MPNFMLFSPRPSRSRSRRARQPAGARTRHLARPRGRLRRRARLHGRDPVHTTLAALGVAAVLRSSPVAFQILKLAGAAYLVWIGIKALRSQGLSNAHARPPQPLGTIFRQSVIGNLMNPKVTLFFVVFLPQFVDPHGAQSVTLQMFELGALFMLQTAAVFSLFGVGAGMIGAWLKRRPKAGVARPDRRRDVHRDRHPRGAEGLTDDDVSVHCGCAPLRSRCAPAFRDCRPGGRLGAPRGRRDAGALARRVRAGR